MPTTTHEPQWRRKTSAKSNYLRAFKLKRANEIRAELIELLGGKCKNCDATENLEFDHLFERTWKHGSMPKYRRHLRYKKEVAQGLIQLLCRSCNAAKGQPAPQPPSDNEPF